MNTNNWREIAEQGKTWIISVCQQIAGELNISVELRWDNCPEERTPTELAPCLFISCGDKSVYEKFLLSECSDAMGARNRDICKKIEARLRKKIEELNPKLKRIGFRLIL